ncbi:type I-E CRISPR-associated protein Cse1/CasA [Corynebacterium gottingense]|uniref:Type I-E CRISPR-associated protein Cse1/CasA n=1 Tax=Corynebacterium gottingense TaxID=2041036 RepID=A0ABX9UHQ8_9CORY|nr:type I-E CRISPR-associated protein Cse1/CasA [Corynebacterium gottingense]RMD18346.1 type I-E CRISPR-associated protein Cse1/CasA [Corynebacterium gottingense]WJZ14183.1 CRISPR-associated protein CasA/Cse1 [Corynebacterium gottingense]
MTETAHPTFNLIEQPWIICNTAEGAHALSIRQIFDGSSQPLSVVGDSPTQDYAVLRVLLAIFWRAHHHDLAGQLSSQGGPDSFDWIDWFLETREDLRHNGNDRIVLDYLNQYQDRFDLLHPEVPFMQVADLHTSKNTFAPVSRIIPEAEHDYFTMRTGKGRATLDFAEAARWVIHTQAYDYSGIKSGAVGDPRLKGGKGYPIGTGWTGMTGGTVVRGDTLLETLLLNSTESAIGAEAALDKPVWERPQDTATQRIPDAESIAPKGAADLATWQERRIRLQFDATEVTGVLVTNGDKIPDAGKNIFGDPMTPYRYSKNQTKKGVLAYYPQQYDTKRTMWKSLDALIAAEGDAGFGNKVHAPKRPETLENLSRIAYEEDTDEVLDLAIVSMAYGPQNSSVDTIVSATMGLPAYLLGDETLSRSNRALVRNAAEATKAAATSLGWFAGQLFVAAGGEYEFNSDAADRLYTLLEPKFIAWLRHLKKTDIEQEAIDWQAEVHRNVLEIAAEYVRGAGQKALIGRSLDSSDDGSSARIINAGSLYRSLQRKLRDDLPLLPQPTHSTPEDSND